MARWIDGELLAKSYLDVAKEEHLTGLIFISPEDVAKTILRLSEEFDDVRPVVHSHWVNHVGDFVPIDAKGFPDGECICSACGDYLAASDEYYVRGFYCPNCGAKMDEG